MDVERRKAAFKSSVDEDSFVEFFDWMAADGRQLISASPVPLYHQLADLLRSWIAVAARPGAKVTPRSGRVEPEESEVAEAAVAAADRRARTVKKLAVTSRRPDRSPRAPGPSASRLG